MYRTSVRNYEKDNTSLESVKIVLVDQGIFIESLKTLLMTYHIVKNLIFIHKPSVREDRWFLFLVLVLFYSQ